MPGTLRSGKRHHAAADHEPRGSDGAGQSFKVAADFTSQGFHGRCLESAQIAIGDTSQDAPGVAGRITYKTFRITSQLACFFLYPLKREVLLCQA